MLLVCKILFGALLLIFFILLTFVGFGAMHRPPTVETYVQHDVNNGAKLVACATKPTRCLSTSDCQKACSESGYQQMECADIKRPVILGGQLW